MKIALLFVLAAALPLRATVTTFATDKAHNASWGKILGAVDIAEGKSSDASILIAGEDAPAALAQAAANHIVILMGYSAASEKLGIETTNELLAIRQIVDARAPKVQIIWEQPVNTRSAHVPESFQVFASERWKGSPVMAGRKTTHGAVLWLATDPGPTGIERYPYILQALSDLGLGLPAQSTGVWAFFDSSYRIRADSDYLALRWRKAGISVLHVAAWHNVEPDPIQDTYLKSLIEACHRHAILVYAWLELPHVSEKFWNDHPEWREKTGNGQDAQLDWRKLMNLENPDCRAAVAQKVNDLLGRFDWDGVNVAELYFESLEGASNPARFTPMNDDVRKDFERVGGFDPKLLFDPSSPYSAGKNAQALRKFLDYRADLAAKMQLQWLGVIDHVHASKPYLDVVLTHIDDRFEPGIRDDLGADVARTVPIIEKRHDTLLVEDPATLWNLGPERYGKLAEKYHELTPDKKNIAVDINVVDRYQEDVYPTKKQTGVELFELVHEAAISFARVALYFENSLDKQDLPLLAAAATNAQVNREADGALDVESSDNTRVNWNMQPAAIDGKTWPIQNGAAVLAPPGKHRVTISANKPAVELTDFNGDIQSASSGADTSDVTYFSRSRAAVVTASKVSQIDIDGSPIWKAESATEAQQSFLLPSGRHVVTFRR